MVVALNYDVSLPTDKISDFSREFYKLKPCHVSPVVSVTESETVEHHSDWNIVYSIVSHT